MNLRKIRNVSDRPVIIQSMTLSPAEEMPVLDEGILESAEVETLLAAGEIEIINGVLQGRSKRHRQPSSYETPPPRVA